MSNFGKYGGSYMAVRTASETASDKTTRELSERTAEVGYGAVTVTYREPTGSRLRMTEKRRCAMCDRLITEGSSFRLRRLPAGSLKACHVSCAI